MRQAVDFNQLLDVDVGVNLGGVEPGMSKHLLDVTQVGAVLQHQCGHRVPEQVATAVFGDAAGLHVIVDHVAQHAGRQAASRHAQEHFALVRFHDEFGPGFVPGIC